MGAIRQFARDAETRRFDEEHIQHLGIRSPQYNTFYKDYNVLVFANILKTISNGRREVPSTHSINLIL